MEVLVYLAHHSRQVITQQELFDAVWPGAIFNPSSIQRAIAVLRKSLGDNAKSPKYIFTFAKGGYSLEHDIIASKEMPNTASKYPTRHILMFLSLISLAALSSYLTIDSSTSQTSYSKLSPASWSDHRHLSLAYSQNGQFMAYIQQVDEDNSHIFIRNIKNGQTNQLNEEAADFRHVSWSNKPDQLVFTEVVNNEFKIGYMEINKLSNKSQQKTELLSFADESILGSVIWSSKDQLYFILRSANRGSKLINYSLDTKRQTILLEFEKDRQIIGMSLSPNESELALSFNLLQNNYQIALFELSKNSLQPIADLKGQINSLSWHPDENHILVGNRKQLKKLSKSGNLTEIKFNNYRTVWDAEYLDKGKRISMILAQQDMDIASSSYAQIIEASVGILSSPIVNSNSLDINPKFSPNGKQLLFESNRNGTMQLWIKSGENERIIFANKDNIEFFGSSWSHNGKKVVFASEKSLFFIDINNESIETITHQLGTFYICDWYNFENSLLVKYEDEYGITAAKLDLDNMKIIRLADSIYYYPTLDDDDNVYIHHSNKIIRLATNKLKGREWQLGPLKLESFFVTRKGIIVSAMNEERLELWKIDPETNVLTLIREVKNKHNYLTEISNDGDIFLFYLPMKMNTAMVTLN